MKNFKKGAVLAMAALMTFSVAGCAPDAPIMTVKAAFTISN